MPENDPGMSFRIKWQGDRGATTHQDLARSRSRGAESAPGSRGHAVLSACRMEPARYRRGSKAGMFLYFKRMACEGHIAHQDSSEAAAMKALGGGSSRANWLARWLAEGGSRCHRRSRPLSSSFTDPFADSLRDPLADRPVLYNEKFTPWVFQPPIRSRLHRSSRRLRLALSPRYFVRSVTGISPSSGAEIFFPTSAPGCRTWLSAGRFC